MNINFDLQVHFSWFKHQDLWHTNVENGATFGSVL